MRAVRQHAGQGARRQAWPEHAERCAGRRVGAAPEPARGERLVGLRAQAPRVAVQVAAREELEAAVALRGEAFGVDLRGRAGSTSVCTVSRTTLHA